jgi:glutamate--cysteine ligase
MVPHLITALTGPLNELEQRVLDSMSVIERWFRLEWMEHTPAFYSSVDVRNAGFKLAPVDTNLFPGCWNHLSADMLPLAVQAAMAAIEKICPEARNLLVIPENGVPSPSYLANLSQLQRIFSMAGLNVRLGSIDPALTSSQDFEVPDGAVVTLEPVVRTDSRIGLAQFDPCTILLNNDLSAGVPGILEELQGQFLLPPLHAGWATRRKSTHFKCYEEVAKRLGKLMGVDPWLINPLYDQCSAVNLRRADGLECLTSQVDAVLTRVRRKYKEYGIKEKPFVVIKADHGTHALGVLSIRDAVDLKDLAERVKAMAKAQPAALSEHDFMIQEGVLTQERVDTSVAEPVVYTMDRYVVGGFYRLHPERAADESLKHAGAAYQPLAFEQSVQLPQPGVKPGASVPNRFYMYGVVARLAMLAASYELEATDPDVDSYE